MTFFQFKLNYKNVVYFGTEVVDYKGVNIRTIKSMSCCNFLKGMHFYQFMVPVGTKGCRNSGIKNTYKKIHVLPYNICKRGTYLDSCLKTLPLENKISEARQETMCQED